MASFPLPPPVRLGTHWAVPIDVERVEARVDFDVDAAVASVEALVDFTVEQVDGCPTLDLRQQVDSLLLDGQAVPGEEFSHCDLGGGQGAEMRVLDRPLVAGRRHRLELHYRLGTPASEGAEPVGWVDGGVRWDLWMSDLLPGRYLEMWLPANLCHDRFALKLELSVRGDGARDHRLLTNGTEYQPGPNRWWVDFPAGFTSLSPMMVLRPEDEVAVRRQSGVPGLPVEVVTAKVSESDADIDSCAADVGAWLGFNQARYGPWAHGDRFTCVLWGPGRGMEYDGATTASVGAVEHEVFHSWFGRGVKPWRASDGWIDEALASWATNSRRREIDRFHVEELSLQEPPVLLYPPHPWSRRTVVEAYRGGSRLMAGIAFLLGGAPQLRSALADWYRANAGGFVTTDSLERHLEARAEGVTPLFRRYVHGEES